MFHHLLLWLCDTDLRNKFAKFGTLPCCGSLRNQCRIYRADNEHLFNKLVTLLYLLNFYLPYRIFTRFDRVLATFLLVSSHDFISQNVPEALYKLDKKFPRQSINSHQHLFHHPLLVCHDTSFLLFAQYCMRKTATSAGKHRWRQSCCDIQFIKKCSISKLDMHLTCLRLYLVNNK